jgi:hypothetical protein
VYCIRKFEYVYRGIWCASTDVNTDPRGRYTFGGDKFGGTTTKGGRNTPSLPYLRFCPRFPSISED